MTGAELIIKTKLATLNKVWPEEGRHWYEVVPKEQPVRTFPVFLEAYMYWSEVKE